MIRPLAPCLAALLALAACAEVQTAVDSTARRTAKGVVAETLATHLPAVPRELISPFTDCIIDNATAEEVQEFTKDVVVGVDDKTATIVRGILARPATVQCVGGSVPVRT